MEPPPRPADADPPDPDLPEPHDAGTSGALPSADAPGGDEKSLRSARLALIREQIAAGAYDSPHRLDAALDGLLADLLD